eukprot:m.131160 g.131160  ORF g.131160 m.131160 type:complete len:101 (+) comp38040_c0_seq11:1703-2005(+)
MFMLCFGICQNLALSWLTFLYVTVMYFFRTPIFMKEAKEYNSGLFFACLVVFFLIGICTAKEASKGDYLNRDQTDEWKGWMQLVILAYHYLGASQVGSTL